MLVTLDGIVTDVSPLQLLNAPATMFVTLDGIVTDVSPLQLLNAPSPMLVTPKGIVTDFNLEQEENVEFSMRVTPDGIVIEVRPSHKINARAPMLVTPDGIVTDVRPAQHANAKLPMLFTPDGIDTTPVFPPGQQITFVFALLNKIPSCELKAVFSGATVNDLSDPQFSNAYSPMLVTLDGIDNDVKPSQPTSAPTPMLFTPGRIDTAPVFLFGKQTNSNFVLLYKTPSCELKTAFSGATVNDSSAPQSANAISPMLVTLGGIVIEVIPLTDPNGPGL